MYVCSICGVPLNNDVSVCPRCRSLTGPFKTDSRVDFERARSTSGLNSFLLGVIGGFVLALASIFLVPEFTEIGRTQSAEYFKWYWAGWGAVVWFVASLGLGRY